MIRNLIQTGNSKALILTKDMRDHLGIEEVLDIEFRRGCLILRHPDTAPLEDSEVVTKLPGAAKPKVEAPKVAKVEKPKAKSKDKPKDKAKKKKK